MLLLVLLVVTGSSGNGGRLLFKVIVLYLNKAPRDIVLTTPWHSASVVSSVSAIMRRP
jgi:hypothetical protein